MNHRIPVKTGIEFYDFEILKNDHFADHDQNLPTNFFFQDHFGQKRPPLATLLTFQCCKEYIPTGGKSIANLAGK